MMLPPFLEAKAAHFTIRRDPSGDYQLVVSSFTTGDCWTDDNREKYYSLDGATLVDVVCAELWNRFGIG
jgi:hypothetical protein